MERALIGRIRKIRATDHTTCFGVLVQASSVKKMKGEDVMTRYFFHLSDGEDSFMDDEGKQLADSQAAHEHALRIIEKVYRFVPEAVNSTWKIKITLESGQSVMTVIVPALSALCEPFGKRTVLSCEKTEER